MVSKEEREPSRVPPEKLASSWEREASEVERRSALDGPGSETTVKLILLVDVKVREKVRTGTAEAHGEMAVRDAGLFEQSDELWSLGVEYK